MLDLIQLLKYHLLKFSLCALYCAGVLSIMVSTIFHFFYLFFDEEIDFFQYLQNCKRTSLYYTRQKYLRYQNKHYVKKLYVILECRTLINIIITKIKVWININLKNKYIMSLDNVLRWKFGNRSNWIQAIYMQKM